MDRESVADEEEKNGCRVSVWMDIDVRLARSVLGEGLHGREAWDQRVKAAVWCDR